MGRRGESLQAEVLEMTRRRNCPSSAYDVLEELRKSNPKLAPTTVYRALAALIDRGRIHRLESLNSYIACQCERHHHASILSICDGCGCVEENVEKSNSWRLLLVGAGSRLMIATFFIAAIWLGYFWATAAPGAS